MTTTIQVQSADRRTQALTLKAQTIMIGSLSSNQVAIPEPGVEPIHAMLELSEAGEWRLTDLGSFIGVKVNGERVVTETTVKAGDLIEIGATKLKVSPWREPVRQVVPTLFGTRAHKTQLREGRLLEVVAYWGNTVLNVDHFAPHLKGFDEVTIGDPTKAHFISGGRELFDSRVLAEVGEQSCTLKLEPDMQVRARQDGEVRRLDGVKRLKLGPRDYAHVEYGAVRYFLHYANHPNVELPVSKRQDRVMEILGVIGLIGYLAMVMVALLVKPKPIPVPIDVWEPVPEHRSQRRNVTIQEIKLQAEPVPVKQPDRVKPVKITQAPQKPVKVPKPVKQPPVKVVVAAAKIGPQASQPNPAPKPGVEDGTSKAPSLPNLGVLGNGFSKVLSKAGGTPVSFKDAPAGLGAKAGSGTKGLGMGGPGNGKSLDFGNAGTIPGWGNGNGLLAGTFGNGSGNGPGSGPGFGGHRAAAVQLQEYVALTNGSLDPSEILRVIRANLNQIRHCYEQTLQRAPKTTGKMTTRFTIGPDGRVLDAGIAEPSIPDVMFRACVTGKIKRWAFPKLPYGAQPLQVTYPFVFNPL